MESPRHHRFLQHSRHAAPGWSNHGVVSQNAALDPTDFFLPPNTVFHPPDTAFVPVPMPMAGTLL